MKAVRHFVALCLRITVIVLVMCGFAWTNLGCGPAAVHVVSADSIAFQQMMSVELAADARRPAHWMERVLRGDVSGNVGILYDDKLPEAYTQDEQRRGWPSEYHLGYAAHRLLREFYAAKFPIHEVLESGNLVEVVDEAGGNLGMLNEFDKDRRPDIADVEGRFVFEMVPPGPMHLAEGKKRVDWNLLLINKAMLGVPTFQLGTGFAGEVGVRFAENAVPWKLSWQTKEPGIVVYEWHALSVEERTEDAYEKAYLDNRWHAPTAAEIRYWARALHEVVERLVQARETLGQTRAASTMPMLPGKTIADYLRSVAAWSAHDDKVAQFLPVMREPPPPPPASVRRGARFVGQTAQGGGGGDPPGGYTVKGKPGNQPINLHMGNAAHNLIGTQYKTEHPGHDVRINTISLQKIVEDAGGDTRLLRPDEALKRPDITDLEDRVVFEIKSSTEGQLEVAKAKVAKDITAINRAMGPAAQYKHGTGFSGDFWVRFTLDMRWWRLTWSTTAPGVLQYNWSKLNDDEVDEAKIMKGIQEGRFTWVDLTLADMQQYAEKCEQFSQTYAVGAAKLYKIQMVTGFVIGVIGDAAIIYLSRGLAPGKTAQPGVRPTVTTPARQPVVTRMAPNAPGPKSPPPVNAPSLGSDGPATFTGSVHPTPRPAAPGKTPSRSTNVSPN